MGRRAVLAVMTVAVVLAAVAGVRAEGNVPLGTVVTVTGSVQVGGEGAWREATPQQKLFDGQTIRAAEGASLRVVFEEDLPAAVAGKAEIAVADLLLKARLEKARARIAAPTDDTKAEMQVTPLTGVRGTEKAEEKAGDLKREHYWNEGAPAAK